MNVSTHIATYIVQDIFRTCYMYPFFFSRIKRGGCIASVCVCMFACLAVCRCMYVCIYGEIESFFFLLQVFFPLFPPLFLRDVFFFGMYVYICMYVCMSKV